MAMSAIAAYHPESRSDYVNIARTIAFSMAALALLAKATHTDMPTPDLMRVFGRANALNRSADQSERTMIQRRAYHVANPPAELPPWMDPSLETSEPDGGSMDDAVLQAAVAEAMREYAAAVAAPQAEPPPEAPLNAATPPAEPAASSARSAAPTVAASTQATTIRYAVSTPDIKLPSSRQDPGIAQADQPQTAPYKTMLLRNAAMPPAAIRSTG
jgi:hypothetical protein